MQVTGEADPAILANCYLMVFKNPQEAITGANIPNANAVGSSDFKRQVFHQEMRMLSDSTVTIPIDMFTGVLRIPRVFQRMGVGDTVSLQLFAPGTTANFCVECIYKEFQ